jgi:hypothetical protein
MDGGEKLRRNLSFLDSAATEEEEHGAVEARDQPITRLPPTQAHTNTEKCSCTSMTKAGCKATVLVFKW